MVKEGAKTKELGIREHLPLALTAILAILAIVTIVIRFANY
jgi:hypothetical protein